jgi:hypothetical protein
MGKSPRKRRLNPKPRHALELLASNSMGATEAPLLAHGFLGRGPECRGFSHTRKQHSRDRTGWLTTQSLSDRSPNLKFPASRVDCTPWVRHVKGRLSFRGLPCDGPDMTALSK